MITRTPSSKSILLRRKARRLFVNQLNTAADIARKLHVTQKTIGKWIKAYDWENARTEVIEKLDKTTPQNSEILIKDLLEFISEKAPHLAKKVEPIINEYLTII